MRLGLCRGEGMGTGMVPIEGKVWEAGSGRRCTRTPGPQGWFREQRARLQAQLQPATCFSEEAGSHEISGITRE